MNNEGEMHADTDGFGHVVTFTYDAIGNCDHIDDEGPRRVTEAAGRPSSQPLAPQGAAMRRKPILTHTFEFRLSGSERAEQVVPLSGATSCAAGRVVAMERVRTYLTRQGEAAATSAIGGVEVHAELREGGIVCTAELSDFGAGDLVVVQVEVALH